MVTEADRDAALSALLTELIEATAAQPGSTTASRRSTPTRARAGAWRGRLITGAVLVAVVTASVVALNLKHSDQTPPAGSTPSVVTPAPGQVLARINGSDGENQTRSIAANGAALELIYRCTSPVRITVTIPGGPGFSSEGESCNGPVTSSSPTPVNGTVPVTVHATGETTWSVTIRVASDNRQASARAEADNRAALETAVYSKLRTANNGKTVDRNQPALTWNQNEQGAHGGPIVLDGKTAYIAAACNGGGSIAIQISGRPNIDIDCTDLTTAGPINLTALMQTTKNGLSLDVVPLTGQPHYFAAQVALTR